ncbi:HAD family hydrolase [Limnoglobus roseus]|uniref:HAD family hydrolase n=1 Tax=Limnoglobus roseus TaxID=2598579 RepID=A0A5C1AE10_9BACT|nr:HAD family hydrolase [Limnoglobus roseus]QEL17619.1 HAD family hydrolase [Limnoglobus roseus]
MPTTRGVLLDVDGTLVDSNDAHAHAWVQAFQETGRSVPFEIVRPLIGMGGDKLLPKVSGIDAESAEGKKVSDRRGEIFLEEFLPTLRPCRGVEELLQLLKGRGLKLVVASSAKERELKSLLRLFNGERYVEEKASSDDADKSKPDPDILHAALKKIALTPAEVVMLGDTPYDVEAARRAKVRVIALRCGGWADRDLAADAVYDDPRDLAARIEQSPLAR